MVCCLGSKADFPQTLGSAHASPRFAEPTSAPFSSSPAPETQLWSKYDPCPSDEASLESENRFLGITKLSLGSENENLAPLKLQWRKKVVFGPQRSFILPGKRHSYSKAVPAPLPREIPSPLCLIPVVPATRYPLSVPDAIPSSGGALIAQRERAADAR